MEIKTKPATAAYVDNYDKIFNKEQEVHIVICNSGDGSNHLRWFKDTSIADLQNLDEVTGDYETWGSGDGVQITTIKFPAKFDLYSLGISWDNLGDILDDYQ